MRGTRARLAATAAGALLAGGIALAVPVEAGAATALREAGHPGSAFTDLSGDHAVGYGSLTQSGLVHGLVVDITDPTASPIDLGALGGSDYVGIDGDLVVANVGGQASSLDLGDPSAAVTPISIAGYAQVRVFGLDGDVALLEAYETSSANNDRVVIAYDVDEATARVMPAPDGLDASAIAIDAGVVMWQVLEPATSSTRAFVLDLAAADATAVSLDAGLAPGHRVTPERAEGGVVVGTVRLPDNARHLFAYDLSAASPQLVDLGTPTGGTGEPRVRDVDDGVVVGTFTHPSGHQTAFAYDLEAPSSAFVDVTGGAFSQAYALDDGVVVGRSIVGGQLQAFAYDLQAGDPEPIPLGETAGPGSSAFAVEGDLVAGATSAGAAVWSLDRVVAPIDGDGDGSPTGTDADDGDPTVHPGAPELCDGKDNDQDGTADEGFVDGDRDGAADCVDPDDDGDGLTDAQDPDTLAEQVTAVPSGSISAGNRNAFLARIDLVESYLATGQTASAVTELRALRQRVDGCPAAGGKADKNDWVTTCADQRAIRSTLDALLANVV